MAYTPPTGAGNVTTASATTGATATVSKPSNLADDDLILWVVYNQVAGTVTTPSGFTHLYHATSGATRTFYLFSKRISATAGSAAAEPSTYSATMSVSGSRWITAMFRLPGMAATSLDAAPASDVYNSTAGTSLVDPAVTAVVPDALCLAFNYTNNSTAVFQTFSLASWANLLNTTVTSGSSTSVVDVEYLQLAASGSTGTKTWTMSPSAATAGGFLITLAVQPSPASGTASLSLSGSGAAAGPNGGSGTAALTLTGSGTAAAGGASGTASLTLTGTASAAGGTLGAWLAKGTPRWCAHRDGFYATYGEFTVAGYNALAAWNPDVAWNIDVFKTSDGEWVASHDQTTGRVLSGTSLDIPTNTWASISGKTTLVGGNPVARIDDIVAVAPAGTIFFVDNKANANTAAFFSKLTALGLSPSNTVNKNFIGSATMLTAAVSNGYTTWAYGFDTDMASFASNHALATWLGFDYAGTQGNWNTIIGYGQLSFAHILSSTANKTTADSKASTAGGSNFGYMVATVSTVVPPAASGTASLTLSGSASTAARATATAALTLTGSATTAAPVTSSTAALTLSASGTARAAATATAALTLTGSGAAPTGAATSSTAALTLTASGTTKAAAAATAALTLTGSGSTTAPISATASLTLSGSGSTAARATATAALTLSGTGSATAPGGATGTASLTLTGSGTVAAGGASGTAALVLSGSSTVAARATATAALTLTGSGTAGSGGSASGTGSLTLSASSSAASAPVGGAASLSLGASNSASSASAGAAAVLLLAGLATPAARAGGSGALSLAAAGGIALGAGGIAALLLSAAGTVRDGRDVTLLAMLAEQALNEGTTLAEQGRIHINLGARDG